MSNGKQIPTVGMGATYLGFTDRHPYTVIQVLSDNEIIVQADKAVRVDQNGMSESQEYTYHRNPDGVKYTVTRRHDEKWVVKGETAKTGRVFHIGRRRKYHDYSF